MSGLAVLSIAGCVDASPAQTEVTEPATSSPSLPPAPPTRPEMEAGIETVLRTVGMPAAETIDVQCLPKNEYVPAGVDPKLLEGTLGYAKPIYAEGSVPPVLTGYVPAIFLRENVCADLIAYADNPDKAIASDVQVQALGALSHEMWHLWRITLNEAEVNCYGFQTIDDIATALGAAPSAASMVQQAAVSVYERMPEDYRTTLCHDGGPYDLQPDQVGIFPYN